MKLYNRPVPLNASTPNVTPGGSTNGLGRLSVDTFRNASAPIRSGFVGAVRLSVTRPVPTNAFAPIDVSDAGVVSVPISVRTPVLLNALAPIVAHLLPFVNDRPLGVEYWKALAPMDTTCVGIIIGLFSVRMLANADWSIVNVLLVKDALVLMSSIVSDVITVLANANWPMLVTVFGSVSMPASGAYLNALAPIVVHLLSVLNVRPVRDRA